MMQNEHEGLETIKNLVPSDVGVRENDESGNTGFSSISGYELFRKDTAKPLEKITRAVRGELASIKANLGNGGAPKIAPEEYFGPETIAVISVDLKSVDILERGLKNEPWFQGLLRNLNIKG